MLTCADGIVFSCNGDSLFFCPLTGRMIYSILTKDIEKSIKEGDIENIKYMKDLKKKLVMDY